MAYPEIKSTIPKFSVIVPLYNKEVYVERALKSIFYQTSKDWELLVVNDGSTDGSFEVSFNLIEGDSRCRIISQANAGVGAARNYGVAESKGEYLCFLDADDWWEPTFLEEMAGLIQEYRDAGLYASNYIYYKPGKIHVAVNHPTGYINYPKLYFDNGDMPVWTGAVCMPRWAFEKYGGFPVGIKLGEDFLLWSRIAVENKIVFLNKPLAYYNNDVPSKFRATRNLHNPKYHMLFNMGWLEREVTNMENNADWKNLLDKLRVKGLLEYWISKEFHSIAEEELKKVDWYRQSKSIIRQFQTPRCIMNVEMRLMRTGAVIKEHLVRTF